MARFNINDKVKFELTEYGKQFLEAHLAEERKQFGIDAHDLYKPNYCGYIKMQVWEFMNLFGPTFKIGFQDQVIVNNELIFCEEF
jgi:hypothetical protein